MYYSKSIFAFLATLCVSSIAHAGVYANIGGAVTNGTYRYSEPMTTLTETNGQINGAGQLGIGYANYWGQFFGGIELGAELQGFNSKKTTTIAGAMNQEGTNSTRLKNDYYLHIKPGYIVRNDFAIYAIAGVLKGQFSYSDVTGDIGNIQGPTYNVTRTGYRAGLGIANVVKNHFEWRFEYTYNGYESIDSSIDDDHSGLPVPYTRSNIHLSQLLFGIGYYF